MMERSQRNIDFICIGAQKAGTTWLYRQLQRQPDFHLPPIKELHYWDNADSYPSPSAKNLRLQNKRSLFGKKIKRIITGQWSSSRWYDIWHHGAMDDPWYDSLFHPQKFSGDITPSYSMLSIDDIKRMHDFAPDIKLIFLIRNPIDRAWSHYRHHLRLHPDEVMDPEEFFTSPAQVLRSDYLRTITDFQKVFDQQSILLCFYDAIASQPLQLMKDVIAYITDERVTTVHTDMLQMAVHAGDKTALPPHLHEILVDQYTPSIIALADTFGSYCSTWRSALLHEAEQTAAPKATILI